MRQYRGLTKDGKWVYGWYVGIVGKSYIIRKGATLVYALHPVPYTRLIEVIPESVGQSTGLKDKNGKEIYEGDIIEYFQYSQICSKCAHRDKLINVVKFGTLGVTLSSYRIIDPMSDISELEIIGKIYENPDLLKEK